MRQPVERRGIGKDVWHPSGIALSLSLAATADIDGSDSRPIWDYQRTKHAKRATLPGAMAET